MAADRGAFVDQSQSLNLFLAEPTNAKLTSMHFYAWKKGLKTGMYYLRSRPAVNAIQFTVDADSAAKVIDVLPQQQPHLEIKTETEMERRAREAARLACSIENKDACEMCSG